MKKIFLPLLLLLGVGLFAVDVPPWSGTFLVDNAKIFNSIERQEIESLLSVIDSQTNNQVAVLTMPTLEGEDVTEFAVRVGEKWGIGKKGDTGVVFIFTTQDPDGQRDACIAVGYGLEGELTDTKSGLILRNVFKDPAKEGKWADGTIAVVKAVQGVITNDEALIGDSLKESEGLQTWHIVLIVLVIILLVCDGSFNSFAVTMVLLDALSGGGSGKSGGGGHFGGGGARIKF
jgi:uncharacterized protein